MADRKELAFEVLAFLVLWIKRSEVSYLLGSCDRHSTKDNCVEETSLPAELLVSWASSYISAAY